MNPVDAKKAFQFCLENKYAVQVTYERDHVTFDFKHMAHAEDLKEHMEKVWNRVVKLNPEPYYARIV